MEMNKLPTLNVEKTGENIKRLRKQAGLSADELRDILRFSNSTTIYRWERGGNPPGIDNLIILAKVFNVKIDDIIVVNDDEAE